MLLLPGSALDDGPLPREAPNTAEDAAQNIECFIYRARTQGYVEQEEDFE